MAGSHRTAWTSLGNWQENAEPLAQSVISTLLPIPHEAEDSRQMRLHWEEVLLAEGWIKGLSVNRSKLRIGYVLNETGMCIQLGNISRVYADLLKLETCFRLGTIKNAILVVPSDEYSLALGTNYAAFSRTEQDISALSPTISVPIILISIDNRRGK